MEKRRFHRVQLSAKSTLSHHEAIYQGQLENISLNGALVRFKQGVILPQSGEYNLSVFFEGEDAPLRLIVEVVYATYALAGIKFVSCEADTLNCLCQLVERFTSEPDKLRTELEIIRKHFAIYLH